MKVKNKWKLITPGDKNLPFWLKNFAGSTSARKLEDSSIFEIYITGRDEKNRSVIGRALWDAKDPGKLFNLENKPVLSLGPLGSFFDSGTSYPYIITVGNEVRMYFTGWMRGDSVPFYNNIGMAVMKEDRSFEPRLSPIVSLDDKECFGSGSMQVIKNEDEFEMLYTSFTGWKIQNNKARHSYELKRRTSKDGIKWIEPSKELKVNLNQNINNVCKPYLHKKDLFFCARNTNEDYSIFYVLNYSSINLEPEHLNLNTDDAKWDSQGQAYPTLVNYNERNYIFYSGNHYGQGGMGVAEI